MSSVLRFFTSMQGIHDSPLSDLKRGGTDQPQAHFLTPAATIGVTRGRAAYPSPAITPNQFSAASHKLFWGWLPRASNGRKHSRFPFPFHVFSVHPANIFCLAVGDKQPGIQLAASREVGPEYMQWPVVQRGFLYRDAKPFSWGTFTLLRPVL